jgi:hypothetical protein
MDLANADGVAAPSLNDAGSCRSYWRPVIGNEDVRDAKRLEAFWAPNGDIFGASARSVAPTTLAKPEAGAAEHEIFPARRPNHQPGNGATTCNRFAG